MTRNPLESLCAEVPKTGQALDSPLRDPGQGLQSTRQHPVFAGSAPRPKGGQDEEEEPKLPDIEIVIPKLSSAALLRTRHDHWHGRVAWNSVEAPKPETLEPKTLNPKQGSLATLRVVICRPSGPRSGSLNVFKVLLAITLSQI